MILIHGGLQLSVVLILHLVLALHGIYVMEQPAGSERVLARHARFEAFANEVCYVPCSSRFRRFSINIKPERFNVTSYSDLVDRGNLFKW